MEIKERIKEMAKTRYDDNIYDVYYKNLILRNKEVLLHNDWYLIYKSYNNELTIYDWLSLNDGNGVKRIFEMQSEIGKLLINHSLINATLREGTSYKIYKLLKGKDYIETIDEYLFLDRNVDYEVGEMIDSLMPYESPDNLRKILLEHPELKEYYPYFLHNTKFKMTDKFIKRYSK